MQLNKSNFVNVSPLSIVFQQNGAFHFPILLVVPEVLRPWYEKKERVQELG